MGPVWEAVSHLERQSFKELSLTCDGASSNRRLWQKKLKKQAARDLLLDKNGEQDRDDDDDDDIDDTEELL